MPSSVLRSYKDYFNIILTAPLLCYSCDTDEETEAPKLNNLPQVTNKKLSKQRFELQVHPEPVPSTVMSCCLVME